MNTLANQRALKVRVSKNWNHDPAHFRFERVHRSTAPFPENGPTRKDRLKDLFDALVGVLALAVLLVIALFSAGAY